MPRVIYSELLQDQPAFQNQGLTVCDGVYAIANGFAPMPAFSPLGNGTLAGPAIGASAYRVASTVYLFAGTATDIYRYQTGGFTSLISGLSTAQGIGLRFQQYSNLMLATNGIDPIKKFDPGSPTTFTNLGGTPPTARYMAVVRGFLVIGYAAGDALRVAWSDNGVPTTWTPGTGEAGFYIQPSGGDITGVVGGEFGLVFQESRILRMSYTADDTIWQFDEIASDIGCIAPNSIATHGRITYFLSNRGFMMTDGASVTPVGAEKIDRTFLSLLSRTYLSNMSAVIDPKNSLYIVMLPSAAPPTTAYVLNYALNKWTTAQITAELLFSALSQGVTLEDLDAIYTYLEAIPISLDDPSFRGGYPLLLLFDASNQLGSLSGPPVKATFVDGQSELNPGIKTRIRTIRLLGDTPTATVTVLGSNTLSQSMAPTSYSTHQASGVYKVRENWNYTQIMIEIPAGTQYSFMQGYDLVAVQGGRA
ncbi:hypothetical protein [Sphingomonas sp.]|uniref:hypothetical protein n=1 Tax=Sphingomonas sp. TaxID=28214 RepID=UPI003B3A3CCE